MTTPPSSLVVQTITNRELFLRSLFVSFVIFCSSSAFAASVLAQPIPNWRIELIAQAPQLRHPSVVACAPDGRVFVAEDPMDISLPKADATEGRILCFHPDGRITVVAETLYAVFGMQYLEGKLYAVHGPKFSVFTDDNGVGRDRVDLIESLNPKPWALDWNDHVPANFRLAMDGYFYLAVGDKGIYGAVGRDGKRVDLHGGGILRLRPDGTELEVYCTGVRNILDVAINSEDEIFTYDNTDEEQWMSRVTHMVDGGFYGYPYDFIPRKPYTLWAMADYGSGAATGTVAYNEDGLPPEYHGNLFLADFGKRQILRLRLEREGASYRVASREDLVLDPPHDFRPVGIAVGSDGTSLYICDWNHTDTKEKVEVGRLLKLVYTGKSLAAPRPHWYLKAAMGQEVGATPEQLMQGLSHPAHSVRLVAQRRLAERGPAVIQPLAELLSDASAPSRARWHALWALDAIDGGSSSRKVILNALGDPDLTLRRQIIRQLGGRRVKEAAPLLARELKSADAAVRFQAATQLGRIGLLETAPALLDALDENDLFTRFAIFTALGRIGRSSPGSWASIVRGLESEREAVRAGTEFALREVFDGELVQLLAKTASDAAKPTPAREAALNLLTGIHRKKPVWKGEWWAYHPVHAPPPRKTEEWAGTESVLEALRAGLEDPQPRIRRASVEGLREARDVASLPKLRELFLKEK